MIDTCSLNIYEVIYRRINFERHSLISELFILYIFLLYGRLVSIGFIMLSGNLVGSPTSYSRMLLMPKD